jgi:hypothetical protein
MFRSLDCGDVRCLRGGIGHYQSCCCRRWGRSGWLGCCRGSRNRSLVTCQLGDHESLDNPLPSLELSASISQLFNHVHLGTAGRDIRQRCIRHGHQLVEERLVQLDAIVDLQKLLALIHNPLGFPPQALVGVLLRIHSRNLGFFGSRSVRCGLLSCIIVGRIGRGDGRILNSRLFHPVRLLNNHKVNNRRDSNNEGGFGSEGLVPKGVGSGSGREAGGWTPGFTDGCLDCFHSYFLVLVRCESSFFFWVDWLPFIGYACILYYFIPALVELTDFYMTLLGQLFIFFS